MPRLCAFGCAPSDARMHCFPNPNKHLERLKIWVQLVGGKLETSSDFEYYKKKRVCDLHFTDADKNRYNWLNALAVPSLHICRPVGNDIAASQPLVNVGVPSLTLDSGRSGSEVPAAPLINLDEPTQPIPPIDTGATVSNKSTAECVIQEHNYCTINRAAIPSQLQVRRAAATPVFNTHLKPLQRTIKYLRTEVSRLRKKGKTFKERLLNAEKLSMDVSFNRVVAKMTSPAKLFVHMQLQASKKVKGRRFSTEEKILSLSLFKRSPKGYALLNKYFTLPSVKAMKRLLSKIKLNAGINSNNFDKIKNKVMLLDKSNRLYSLIFDEMSLTSQIFYNAQKDVLDGFTTVNDGQKFADHALLFMVKSLNQKFKQPIAYYFTNALSKVDLKNIIKTVVKHAQDSGLIIINTVCDQSTVNVSAINDLIKDTKQNYLRQGKEWRHDFFLLNGQKIVPIFDVPHLIKGIRNNLISKDLRYTINSEEKTVKWEYFEMEYRADRTQGELRLLKKLTEEHINKEKMNKMKVKLATQLFSRSVAVLTHYLVDRGDVAEECRQLIDITILFDNLFDSLNVNKFAILNGKIYQGPIKRNSPHHQLWQDAKTVLKTIKFIEKKQIGNKIRLIEKTIPSVTNFIRTIEGMEEIWKTLSRKYNYDVMLTRNFNQDPIENYIAPNSVAFQGAFKALLVNNYSSPHSNRANCEEDQNEALQSLIFFFQ